MDIVKVAIRREIVPRITGDSIVHWLGRSQQPRLSATARCLDGLERALRSDLPPDTRIEFELEAPSIEAQTAIDTAHAPRSSSAEQPKASSSPTARSSARC